MQHFVIFGPEYDYSSPNWRFLSLYTFFIHSLHYSAFRVEWACLSIHKIIRFVYQRMSLLSIRDNDKYFPMPSSFDRLISLLCCSSRKNLEIGTRAWEVDKQWTMRRYFSHPSRYHLLDHDLKLPSVHNEQFHERIACSPCLSSSNRLQ